MTKLNSVPGVGGGVMIGQVVFDQWTHQRVTVVAGAQSAGWVTVQFHDGTVCTVRREHVKPLVPNHLGNRIGA